MIDLHTHTNYSDGTWSVGKLLEEAEKAKIEVLSITDHNTVKGYRELRKINYSQTFSGDILLGVELDTVYEGVKFELLAYDFDYEKLDKWIYENYETKKPNLETEFEFMKASCKRNNIKIGDIKYNPNLGWPVDTIFPEIKKWEENRKYFTQEEWENIDVFYNSCVTNREFPAFVDFSIHYPSADKVAKVVHMAEGKLFIAHAFRYRLNDTLQFIDILKENNIVDGVEVYHSSFTEEQSKILEKYCKENKLLMSGGSDCHGEKKANRKVGSGYGNMNVSKNILNDWKIKN